MGDNVAYFGAGCVERVHLLPEVHLLNPVQQHTLHTHWLGDGRSCIAAHGGFERFQPAVATNARSARRRRCYRRDFVLIDIRWRGEDAQDVGTGVDGGGAVDLAAEEEDNVAIGVE